MVAAGLALGLVSPAQALVQCSGVKDAPEIAGFYVDNYSGWHSIGKTAWLDFSKDGQFIFEACSIDNAKISSSLKTAQAINTIPES